MPKFETLIERIVKQIMDMKNGTENTTPQVDCARDELAIYQEIFRGTGIDLNAAIRDALKAAQ